MMTTTIKISKDNKNTLNKLASKNETYNDVIGFLVKYYIENEEFTDAQAEYYNNEIEKFENGDRDNVTKLTLTDLEKRIEKLENEIKNDI